MCTQDPLYRAAACSTLRYRWLDGYQTVVQERTAAPFRSPKSPYLLQCMALAPCTPHHLVTPRIPALMNQDWFLVLHLANLDAQEE